MNRKLANHGPSFEFLKRDYKISSSLSISGSNFVYKELAV